MENPLPDLMSIAAEKCKYCGKIAILVRL